MTKQPAFEPAPQAVVEEAIVEIVAPERAVLHAGLGQRAVQVQHADQSGPLAAPVGDRQDRPPMGEQPGQDVMAVLPDGLDHDQRRIGGNLPEDFHAVPLAVDESVPLFGVDWMAAADFAPKPTNPLGYGFFDGFLGRPAELIGRRTQVAAGDENHGLRHTPHAILTKDPLRFEPVAQLVEHRTFNAMVPGSSPARLTILSPTKFKYLFDVEQTGQRSIVTKTV